jgi:valyl-tRNA synthetase
LQKGIIDIDKELQKLESKKEKLQQQITSLNKDMSKKDYEDKVPETVRLKNREKVCRQIMERMLKIVKKKIPMLN